MTTLFIVTASVLCTTDASAETSTPTPDVEQATEQTGDEPEQTSDVPEQAGDEPEGQHCFGEGGETWFYNQFLVARYNSFKKVWARKTREMGEGRVLGRPQRGGAAPKPAAVSAAARRRRGFFVPAGGGQGGMPREGIFRSYKELREECGESPERLRLESFTRILSEKVERLRTSQQCEEVEIRLRREKDKCRILVRPRRTGS